MLLVPLQSVSHRSQSPSYDSFYPYVFISQRTYSLQLLNLNRKVSLLTICMYMLYLTISIVCRRTARAQTYSFRLLFIKLGIWA